MYTSMTMRSLFALLLAGAALGCDATKGGKDASAPLSQRVAEVSVRVDVPQGGAPSVSVLAFQAAVLGLSAPDVLGVVDPLVARAPDLSCELRDVAGAARSLRSAGGSVELEELANVRVALDADTEPMRPAPRVYPPLAAVVSGVIAEAGPLDVGQLPTALIVSVPLGDGQAFRSAIQLPEMPQLLDERGLPLGPGSRLSPADDLRLQVIGPVHGFVELRPFGGTLALACPRGEGGKVTVPREMLARMLAASGRVPVSVEAVWRDSRTLQAGDPTTRLSVEARVSAVLEQHP